MKIIQINIDNRWLTIGIYVAVIQRKKSVPTIFFGKVNTNMRQCVIFGILQKTATHLTAQGIIIRKTNTIYTTNY